MSDCTECCAALDCRMDAAETNITELFSRTDQLKEYIEEHFFFITTEAELAAFLLAPVGIGYIVGPGANGEIELSQQHEVAVAGTHLEGGGLTFPYSFGAANSCLKIMAKNVRIEHVKFDMENTCVAVGPAYLPGSWSLDIVIEISHEHDCSGLVITHCEFVNFFAGIRRDVMTVPNGAYVAGVNEVSFIDTSMPYSDNCEISHNYFHHFCGYAMFVLARMRNMEIHHNVVSGWDFTDDVGAVVTESTMAYEVDGAGGNAFWIGNKSDYVKFHHNTVKQVNRHGFEYWNSRGGADDPYGAQTNGNRDGQCCDNVFYQIQGFASSMMGSGTIKNHGNIFREIGTNAIESVGDNVNTAFHSSIGNIIESVIPRRTIDPRTGVFGTGSSAVGISINGITGGKYSDNFIGICSSKIAGMDNFSRGITFIGSVHAITNVDISDNEFINAGDIMIEVNGAGIGIANFKNIWIQNNKFVQDQHTYRSNNNLNVLISYMACVYLDYSSPVIVKDNTLVVTSGLLMANDGAGFRNYGGAGVGHAVVYNGHNNNAPMTGDSEIMGSNLTIIV